VGDAGAFRTVVPVRRRGITMTRSSFRDGGAHRVHDLWVEVAAS
jgi:hypothetical protein